MILYLLLINKMPMKFKFGVSNIAWSINNDVEVLEFLKKNSVTYLEIAPTKLHPYPYENFIEINNYLKNTAKDFSVFSIQSICFGKELNIFRSEQEMRELLSHTKKVCEFSKNINCENIVFGCPKNRNIENENNRNLGDFFFKELDFIAKVNNVNIALEPNPVIYGTNFLNSTLDTASYIKKNKFKNIKLNFDLGTVIYNNEDLSFLIDNIEIINHIHISEPFLAPLENRDIHLQVFKMLNDTFYNKGVSIEMKELDVSNFQQKVLYIQRIINETN